MSRLLALVLLAVTLIFVSCQESDYSNAFEEVNVNLRVNPFNIYTESIQKSTDAKSAGVKSIVIKVFDTEGKEAYSASQLSTDANYGTADFTLKAGTYSLVVIGYGNSTTPTISSSTEAKFTTSYLSDTFSASRKITLGQSANEDISMTLTRAVSCFRVVITDDVPSDAKTFVTTFSRGSCIALNPTTGLSATDNGSSFSKAIPSSKICDAYTFLGTIDQEMTITFSVLNADSDTLASRTFNNVVLEKNRATVASGELFSNTAKGTFSFNNTWSPSNSITW